MMTRTQLRFVLVAILLSSSAFAQNATRSGTEQAAIVRLGQQAAIAALNFQQGDAAGFTRSREDFTTDSWKNFVKSMEGFLDQKGAPTFTSSFVAAHHATVVDEKEGVLHIKIPGTIRSPTPGSRAIQIQRLEQITCDGTS